MSATTEAYERPAIIDSEPERDPEQLPGEPAAFFLVAAVAVAAGTWVVVGVEAATYTRKKQPSRVALGNQCLVVVTLPPAPRVF